MTVTCQRAERLPPEPMIRPLKRRNRDADPEGVKPYCALLLVLQGHLGRSRLVYPTARASNMTVAPCAVHPAGEHVARLTGYCG